MTNFRNFTSDGSREVRMSVILSGAVIAVYLGTGCSNMQHNEFHAHVSGA